MNKRNSSIDSIKLAEEHNANYIERIDKEFKRAIIRVAVCFFIIIGILLAGLYFFVPIITLNGDKVLTVSYNENYIESGAKATCASKDISEDIKIDSDVVDGKLGEYRVESSVKRNVFTARRTRVVKVVDDVAPTILLNGDKSINICPNGRLEDAGYVAHDEYDGDLTNKVTWVLTDEGVTYTVEDSSGNKVVAKRVVIKEDIEKPTITLKGYGTMYLTLNKSYDEPGFSASDNCDGDLSLKVEVINNVDVKRIGKYTVIYKVKDSVGNEALVERIVYVTKDSNVIPTGPGIPGVVYLTFDDGPSASITPRILDILKARNIKATFFVINTGSNLDYLIKRAFDEGHSIALHSNTHNYAKIYTSLDAYYKDLEAISNKVEALTGIKSMIIRFPGGSSNTVSRKYSVGIMTKLSKDVVDKGYHYFDWNVSSGDAGGAKTKEEVYRNVTSGLSKQRSNVVLMHDYANNYKTLNALDDIISYGLNNGYTFDVIDMTTEMIRHRVNN